LIKFLENKVAVMLRVSSVAITPIADESLGVRSMSLFVETPDTRILFDAGVSLGPHRYGLPPHPEEFRALNLHRERVAEFAEKAEIVTISHYHRDHFTPPYASLYECTERDTFFEVYSGKTILAKSQESNINHSQKLRARALVKALEESKAGARLVYLDNNSFKAGDTLISGFLAMHGDERLGWVLCFKLYVAGEPILAFMPDVQGPVSDEALQVLLGEGFRVAVIGGPPTYLTRESGDNRVKKGLENLSKALRVNRVNVLSHHILRDPDWRGVLEEYAPGAEVKLYSEIAGFEFTPLEAYRNLLYETDPPPASYLESLRRKTLKCSDL
jgi:predicted metallo-beta-lactamase superfamily hydrolase